jgi:hypothetical protein
MQNDHHLNDYCAADRRLEQLREETPQDVARKFADRWPEILIWGAVVAVGLLAGTGWL